MIRFVLQLYLFLSLSFVSFAQEEKSNNRYVREADELLLSETSVMVPRIEVCQNGKGVKSLIFEKNNHEKNYIDRGKILGDLHFNYITNNKSFSINLSDLQSEILENIEGKIQLFWELPAGIKLYQTFIVNGENIEWNIDFFNNTSHTVDIMDMYLTIPIGSINKSLPACQNLSRHFSLNGNSSFLYWIPYTGQGDILLMSMKKGTAMEYATWDGRYYLHSKKITDCTNDTWRIPSTSKTVSPYQHYHTGFDFVIVKDYDDLRQKLYEKGNVIVKVAPGMVVTQEMEVYCTLQTQLPIEQLIVEYPKQIKVINIGKTKYNKYIYKFRFSRLGENQIKVKYGNGNICYLDFFVTEPLETLIKKRSRFIVDKQQHRDTTKWYNGLYSLWDMKNAELLSPDYLGEIQEEFMVGGSDDPSNGKPIYVSEKNVIYPDKSEIASLEYYQKNFVWGKLQHTDMEFPYPYGIYGSENWYQNRSGKYGGYEDGGFGKGRMWRTFDYTTHFAIYYNLYRIAKNHPDMVTYLNADEYLERAYRTAMAFFEVPYNILMGKQWNFHGWNDWAYKQGNFHERYLLYIISALENEGRKEAAAKLRCEWEKKVTYMIYEESWPFGSEMFVDRTAFESSYYIAEYAKLNPIQPKEQFWFDKNKKKWYSYTSFDTIFIERFMQKQLDGNLAMRGIFEPGYTNLGTAWSGQYWSLDYMTQMGGVALLDYAYRFSSEPEKYINYGYNSLLASWALMNTGTQQTDYGYWYKGKENDGAVGWAFSPYQNSHTYMSYIKTGRRPWRYDGEIDHGLTGGIHGAGLYLINDSDFGLIAYGGNVIKNKEGKISMIPYDGVRRQIRFLTPTIFSIELEQDGFRKDFPITLRKTKELTFVIENRSEKPHHTMMTFEGKLCDGEYTVIVGNQEIKKIEIINQEYSFYRLNLPILDKYTQVIIRKEYK